MKRIEKVRGSKEASKQLIIGVDTVYLHSNIVKIDKLEDGTEVADMYEYTEEQYTLDEWYQKQFKGQDNMLLDLEYRLSLKELE